MNQKTRHFYSFGPFRLDARECLLNLDGKPVPLAPKAFEALLMLVENAGQLVDKDDLMRRLWPGTFVEEGNVAKHVSLLRKILSEATNGGEYIETIPKRGYRFVVEVRKIEASEAGSQPQTIPGASMSGKKVSHYRVLQVLGGGGMGVVYTAQDLKLGRRVALKFLPEEIASNAKVLERFEREARAASALDHPNICAIHEFGEHEGRPFIAMSLLEGQNLRDQIAARASPFATDELLHLAIQIAEGLAAAHEKGIVHRDVKPANIFITNRSEAKILDFGSAKLTYAGDRETYQEIQSLGTTSVGAKDVSLSLTGVAMGTAPYMSPEQVRGEKLDGRSDLFSFGLVLYEMATGERTFSGDTATALHEAILNRTHVPAKDLNPELPPTLEEIINKALEKDRVARYQSAAEMCADLKRLKLDTEYSRRVITSSKVVGTASAVSTSAHSAGGSTLLTLVTKHKWGLAAGLVLAGLLLAEVLHSTHSLRSSNVSQATIKHKQFTFSGNAYEPAISPDGLFVAYVSRKPNQEQSLMVQASNGAQLELARSAVITFPRWSPDGSEVLFYRLGYGVSVVSRLGGVVRTIGRGFHACWFAPDGSQVVTASTGSASGFKGFRLVNNRTGDVKEVRLSEYTWLLDVDCSARAGLILAVTDTAEKSQIRVFKPDGGEEHTLVEDKDEIYAARWSPAGDYIYYLHGKGSTQELSKISVTRKRAEPAALANGLQTGGFFTLSADGSRLAYTREDHHSNLWRVALPTGKRAKVEISLLTSGTSYYGAPSFSPDGRWVAFAFGPNADEANIFKMQVAGGERTQLTFFEHATTASPAWSRDGQRIAFISDQNGMSRVWTVSANGGTAQPLGHTNASDTNLKLAWWPSSNIVYQQAGNRNFLQIQDKTPEERILIQHDKSIGFAPGRPVFSPDGNRMAVFWNREERGLWIISLEPYSETLLLSGAINPFGWSPDGKHVYAIRGGAGQSREVISVQVDIPNQATPVATLPGDVVDSDGASVSPDGKDIFASVSEKKSDIWLMENFDPAVR